MVANTPGGGKVGFDMLKLVCQLKVLCEVILCHENCNVQMLSALAGQPIFVWGVCPLSRSITPHPPPPTATGARASQWGVGRTNMRL